MLLKSRWRSHGSGQKPRPLGGDSLLGGVGKIGNVSLQSFKDKGRAINLARESPAAAMVFGDINCRQGGHGDGRPRGSLGRDSA